MKWQCLWGRKFAPFMMEAFLRAFTVNIKFGKPHNKISVPEGKLQTDYFRKDDWQRISRNYIKFVHSKGVKNYVKQYEKEFKVLLNWAKKISRNDFAKFSNQKLAQTLKATARWLIKVGDLLFMPFMIKEGPAKKLEAKLSNQPEVLQVISILDKETQITKARLELISMVKAGKTSDRDLVNYQKTYAWLPVYEFIDEPLTVAEIKKQIEQIKNPDAELKNFYQTKRQGLKRYRQFLKTVKDPEFKKLVELVHYFAYLKEVRDDYRRHAYYLLQPFWREVGKRLNIPLEDTNYLLSHELSAILTGKSKLDPQIIKKRQKHYSMRYQNGKLTIYAADLSTKWLGKIDTNIQELTGMPAQSGLVKGPVKIIYHRGEFDKFKQGDVLVTLMTHPEFLTIMKQASAIITDEGGITCHAAIVARELGIPCVIGTRIATKVFKDGDRVEVDANKGLVRRL